MHSRQCLETHSDEMKIDDWTKKLDVCFSNDLKVKAQDCFDTRSDELLEKVHPATFEYRYDWE